MKWSERTSVEKAVLLLGLVCVAASAVLVVLDLLAVFECAYLVQLLIGAYDLSMAVVEKRKNWKIYWYILAAFHVAFGVLYFFF